MIEDLIAEILEKRKHTWYLDDEHKVPTAEDVMVALDKVAAILYPEEAGTRLEVGGLIIDKTANGHDVYVYVGSYL